MHKDDRKEPRPIINIPVNVYDGITNIEGATINVSGSGLCYSRPNMQCYEKGRLLILTFIDPFSQMTVHYLGEVVHDAQSDNCSITGVQFQQLSSINHNMIKQIVSESALPY